MESYLKTTLHKLKTTYYSELNLVIGNESCDLDSAVAAIVYAAFLDWQYDKIKCCKVCTRFSRDETEYKDSIYVPVLNVDREDFPLKTEVVHCLKGAGITPENLVFRDDFNFEELVTKTSTKVTLVDHHTLARKDVFLTPYVTEIVDHRPLDKTHWGYKEDTRTTTEMVGSCCTLITQRIRDLSALVATEVDFFNNFKICCDMLHSTIILDTVNFSKEVDKATPHDVEMVTLLETILQPADVQVMRQQKLDSLVCARGDVSSLNAAQLLRKDVKTFGDVLVPSFPILVKEFLGRPGAMEAVGGALAARGGSVALLLGMSLRGGLRRDAAAWSPDTSRTLQLCELLQSWQPSLDLSADELPDKSSNKLEDVRYFTQNNLRASRKQYIPAVMEFLNK